MGPVLSSCQPQEVDGLMESLCSDSRNPLVLLILAFKTANREGTGKFACVQL